MSVYGSRKRYLFDENGERVTLIIRRMKCDSCSRIHHELPDCIVPYKQYSSAVIEALLSLKGDDIKEATFPGESSSMYRIISWFSLLRLYFEGVLNSLKLQWKDDLEIQKDLASLLPLVATSLPAGLAEDACPICRKLGILATDPLCIVCPPVN